MDGEVRRGKKQAKEEGMGHDGGGTETAVTALSSLNRVHFGGHVSYLLLVLPDHARPSATPFLTYSSGHRSRCTRQPARPAR